MFYRTGGLSKRLFQTTVAEYCDVVTFAEGETIDVNKHFYIIYRGTVKLTVTDDNGDVVSSRKAQSGQLFDFRALGLLEDVHSLAKHRLQAVVAVSPVTLFRFPRHKMIQIASNPTTRLMWKELLMENLLRIVQRYFDKRIRKDTVSGREYLNPLFLPLQGWEEPHPLRAGSNVALQRPLSHVWASMKWSFAPPWPFKGPPMGLRHNQLLATGRVHNFPPKRLLDTDESQSLMENGSEQQSYQTCSSGGEEAEEFLEYLHEIDEEMGGLNFGFRRAVSWKLEEEPAEFHDEEPIA
jgi:hypothetical protein